MFARQEQCTLECVGIAVYTFHKYLFDARASGFGQRAAHRGLQRDGPPTGHLHPTLRQRGFQCGAAVRGSGLVVRQKHIACGKLRSMQMNAGIFRQVAYKYLRAVDQYAATIARQAIGRHPTAMRHIRQRLQRAINNRPRTFAVHLCNQAKTARVMFAGRVIQTPSRAAPHRSVQSD